MVCLPVLLLMQLLQRAALVCPLLQGLLLLALLQAPPQPPGRLLCQR